MVDDDSDMRALVRGALERDGHAVTALACGAQVTPEHCAWAHCILLDVMMPGEDGFATVSYTHLDVYKRQRRPSAPPSRTGAVRFWSRRRQAAAKQRCWWSARCG